MTVTSVPPLLFVQTTPDPPLEQLALNCVVAESAGVVQLPPPMGDRFMPFHPVEPPSDPVQDVAPLEVQLKVAVPPEATDAVDAFKVHEDTVCEVTVKVTVDTAPSANVAFAVQVPSCA